MFQRAALIATVFILGVGCQARIQHGLDERQANELQTVLLERGISATKVSEKGKKPTWAIEVEDSQSQDATRILAELGLPRPKSEGFSEVFGKGSIVPTATEERALFLQAMSGEISRTLEAVEGVVSARVHLVLPPPARSGVPATAAKASAFLKVRPGAADRVLQAKEDLRALVAGSVEGLSVEGVTLVVNEVATQVVPSKPVTSGSDQMRLWIVVLGTMVMGLALGLVFLLLRLRHERQAATRKTAPSQSVSRPTLTPNAARKAA